MIKITKNELRKKYLEYRNNLAKEQQLCFSRVVAEKLDQLQWVIEAENIMCFVSIGSEIATHELIKGWLNLGKKVSVPCLEKLPDGNKVMHAVLINSFSDLKTKGSFGILEPELGQSVIIEPCKLDVVIVPGSVFDIYRNRMGYGGGFYDRFLKETSEHCKKIGICYDFQVRKDIPHEAFDVPVDLIITEKRIV